MAGPKYTSVHETACDALRDLVSFEQFKKREKHPAPWKNAPRKIAPYPNPNPNPNPNAAGNLLRGQSSGGGGGNFPVMFLLNSGIRIA